jgi:signal transduction histidine kinase
MGEARTQAWTLARTLAATFKYYHMEDQHQRIGELIHAVMPHGDDVNSMQVNIYDRHGELLDYSFEHGENEIVPNKPIEKNSKLIGGGEKLIKKGSLEFLSVTSPIINSSGEYQGTVEIILSLEKINNNLVGIVHKFIAFTLLTSFLLGILIYLIGRWSISLPISKLKEAAKKLGHGNLGLRIDKSGVSELDDLIEEFNRMAHNIEQQNIKKDQLFDDKLNLEKRLRHTDKLASIGQLASGLAHEIGTPLNVISGRAEHILKKLPENDPGAESLKNIIRQSERITKTMEQLLAFSRKPSSQLVKINLEQTVNEAFSLCKLRQRSEQPKVEISLDLTIKDIVGDEDGIRQLFVNLILNSFNALQNGGNIRVKSNRSEDPVHEEIIITYEDDGPGVPLDRKDKIFDPFYTTKDIGEGTGLGLFMVANIIEERQGRIELDANYQDGARFIIYLPVSPNSTLAKET